MIILTNIPRKLNLGCGKDIKEDTEDIIWDNLDFKEGDGVNITHDLNKFPYPINDNYYDGIEVRQVLQLLDRPDLVLLELRRIAKPNAELKITVGYYHNKGQWNDILTKHAFSEVTFQTFIDHPAESKSNKDKFEIIEIKKTPTWFGYILIFEFIRHFVDLFISGVYSLLIVRLKNIK